jgi:hypothetical protein
MITVVDSLCAVLERIQLANDRAEALTLTMKKIIDEMESIETLMEENKSEEKKENGI